MKIKRTRRGGGGTLWVTITWESSLMVRTRLILRQSRVKVEQGESKEVTADQWESYREFKRKDSSGPVWGGWAKKG